MTEAVGGTYTFTVGDGVSDPVPYDASGEAALSAYRQAIDRNIEARLHHIHDYVWEGEEE